MLVRTRARARAGGRRSGFTVVDFDVDGGRVARRMRARAGGMEFDWGADGIVKTMWIRDGWVHGTFEREFRGRSLLWLPIYYPLAALFVRIETRRGHAFEGTDPPTWTSHHDAGGGGPRCPDYPPDDGDPGVREPRRPRPPVGGATTELPPDAA